MAERRDPPRKAVSCTCSRPPFPIQLSPYPLARLNSLLGTAMDGRLEARGVVRGPLRHLRPDLDLRVERPRAGPLRLEET
ncbi:MAG: hypothetical protein ACKOPT_17605, partial [Cyanobium sp.]